MSVGWFVWRPRTSGAAAPSLSTISSSFNRARTSSAFRRWPLRWATKWPTRSQPARARSPTRSSALCRTHSSRNRSSFSTGPSLVEDQQVLVRGPRAQAARHQPVGFLLQHERAAGGQLAAERLGRDRQLQRLPADRVARAVVQAKLDDISAVGAGPGFDPALVVAQPRDVAHDQLRSRRRLLDDAGRVQSARQTAGSSRRSRAFRPRRPRLRSCRSAGRPGPP